MLPKALLLDLDDTIISFDHGVDLDRCWKEACSKHLHVQDANIEHVVSLIKSQATWFWSDPERHRIGRMDLDRARISIVAKALEDAKLDHRAAAERIATEYGMMRDEAVSLYPGAVEALHYFRDAGMKLALITNGSSRAQRKKIERFGLAPLFDCIIIEEEFGAGKPAPEVYIHALEQLGVRADEAWMIGDRYEWEVAAPQKLGIKGVWVNPKGTECPSPMLPFRTIDTLSEVISFFTS
ncbi:HAD family hydrolase [Paenibacillus thermotolerans]|uniref:HAD family hydrolase n=1 Tax=Paenibacillus thermotolerans TaxID=3027807 RepID=UPI0023679C3B|nr:MULTISPECIES: HAD family hydrolase [unclassified Paenibacillus]